MLANDTPTTGQAGAPTVSAVAVQGGATGAVGQPVVTDFGTLTLNSNGSYSYVALDNAAVKALAAGQTHTDVFSYTITNSSGSATGRLDLTITGVNDAPITVADTVAVTEDAATNVVTGNVLANDSDPDAGAVLKVAQVAGQTINLSQAIVGKYGTLFINANGSYEYTLDNSDPDTQALGTGQRGEDVFSYQISDGAGGTATGQFTVTVNGHAGAVRRCRRRCGD